MGNSQPKQDVAEKSDRQIILDLQNCVKKLRIKLKCEVAKLESNSRKIKLQLKKVMINSTSDTAKRAIITKHLKNNNEIQRYLKFDVHLEDALYNMRNLKSTDGLVDMVKQIAEVMGVPYQSMKKVRQLDEVLKVFERQIECQIQNYNVLESDQEEEPDLQKKQEKSDDDIVLPNSSVNPQPNKMTTTFSPIKTVPSNQLQPPINISPPPNTAVVLNNQVGSNSKVTSYVIQPLVTINRAPVTDKDVDDFLKRLNPPKEEEEDDKSKNSKQDSVRNKKN